MIDPPDSISIPALLVPVSVPCLLSVINLSLTVRSVEFVVTCDPETCKFPVTTKSPDLITV